jgi:hypothetical protein
MREESNTMANDCEPTQYDKTCKAEFHEIKEQIERLNKRLYVDNGTESLQSRLNRHERYIHALGWLCGTAAAASIVTIVGMALKLVASALANGGV